MIKKAEELEMTELKVSERTKNIVEQQHFTTEELVQMARIDAYKQKSNPIPPKIPQWRLEVIEALDRAGYIRHDIVKKNLFLLDQFRKASFRREPYGTLYTNIKELAADDSAYTGQLATYETQVEIVKKLLSTITEREQDIIGLRLGLDHDQPYSYAEAGKFFNISKQRAQQIEDKGHEKLGRHGDWVTIDQMIEQIEIYKQNSDSEAEEVAKSKLLNFIQNDTSIAARKATIYLMSNKYQDADAKISYLNLSVRARNKLEANDITTVKQLIEAYKTGRINSILRPQATTACEVTQILLDLNIHPTPELEQLKLSVRAYNCLIKSGHLTIASITALTRKELESIRNMGCNTADEIESQLSLYGYKLSSES